MISLGLGPWDVVDSKNNFSQDLISIRDSATRNFAHISYYLYRLSNLGFSREVKHLAQAYNPESDLFGPSITMFDNTVREAENLDVDFGDFGSGHPPSLPFPFLLQVVIL